MERFDRDRNGERHGERHRGMGLRLLVSIVNRPDCQRAALLLKQARTPIVLTLLAKGTSGAGVADLLGFGEMDKAVVLCVTPGVHARLAMEALSAGLQLHRPHRGIAFLLPISGMDIRGRIPIPDEKRAHIQAHIEEGVDAMMNTVTHELVLAVVGEGMSEALVERARQAGAPGATVFSARQAGAEMAEKMLGLRFDPEREVVAILTPREGKQPLMDALGAHLSASAGRGIVFSLPVDGVAGLAEE